MIARDIERVWRDEVPVSGKHGGDRKSEDARDQERGTPLIHNHSTDGILARLKRDNPDLARRVIDGEITANAG